MFKDPAGCEELTDRIIGCAIAVHRFFGAGLLESVYEKSLIIELTVLVEVKAVLELAPIHNAQVITYLKLTRCPVGLLINFNSPLVTDGVRRLKHPDLYVKNRG